MRRPSSHSQKPFYKGSVFGPGRRVPLSNLSRSHCRQTANALRRGGLLLLSDVEVLAALLRRLGADGRCDPSYATLAKDTALSESTVGRSLNRLRQLNLVDWERRVVRDGPRCAQTSNAYRLVPRDAAEVLAASNRHPDRGTANLDSKRAHKRVISGLPSPLPPDWGAVDLLARRRAQFEKGYPTPLG